jgi:ABC-2 type transport system ATP-binding protein
MVRFGLEQRSKDRVRTLSGGLRRRVALAKGLLHRPQILMLDEPTQGLDPGARLDFWRYLRILRDEEGITILFTTHLMEETEQCDHLVILSKGEVVASGSPEALKEKVGGDVIVIRTPNPESLGDLIKKRFTCEATVVDGTVRLERHRGYELAAKLMESYSDQIEALTVGKPTLEDVFVHVTGHHFEESQESSEVRSQKSE